MASKKQWKERSEFWSALAGRQAYRLKTAYRERQEAEDKLVSVLADDVARLARTAGYQGVMYVADPPGSGGVVILGEFTRGVDVEGGALGVDRVTASPMVVAKMIQVPGDENTAEPRPPHVHVEACSDEGCER